MGPDHLPGLKTIVDPIVMSELPTVLWCPHGHDDAVTALRGMIDVTLLDSDDMPDADEALDRAQDELNTSYVVDLAWLRTTPWRERLAASFDPPGRRTALAGIDGFTVRHQASSTASALLLAGWLASRLRWDIRPSARCKRRRNARAGVHEHELEVHRHQARGGRPERARPLRHHRVVRRAVPSRSTVRTAGCVHARSPSMAITPGSCWERPAARAGSWGRVSGRHCSATRRTGRRCRLPGDSSRMPVEIEVVDDPGRACAAMLVGVAASGWSHRAHGGIDSAGGIW